MSPRPRSAAFRPIALVLAFVWVAGCDAPPTSVDSDGDGLEDAAEIELGTSPYLPDTDGDGYSDFVEVVDQGFDPERDATHFNPRVADVPELRVEFVRAPKVHLRHTDSASNTHSFDNSRSDTSSEGFTTGRTDSESTRTELSSTFSSTQAFEASLSNFGSSLSLTESETSSQANEQSVQWSSSHSRENGKTLSESRGFQRSNDIVKSGGEVEVVATLTNGGHIAFALRNIAIGAEKLDDRGRHLADVGQLELDTTRSFFDVSTLAPGETMEKLVFTKQDLNLEKAEQLLQDGALVVRPAHFELVDEQGVSFDHRFTEIAARTATLIVDDGKREPVSYRIATNAGEDRGLSLEVALRDVLRIPFETGTTLWKYADQVGETRQTLVSLAGIGADSAAASHWVLKHTSLRSGTPHETGHHALRDDLDLAGVHIQTGDRLRLVYVTDADRDGLGSRAEFLFGTDPANADTDGDGMKDGAEAEAGRHPRIDEAYPGVAVAATNVVEQELSLSLETEQRSGEPLHALQIDWGDGSAIEEILAPAASFVHNHRYAEHGRYAIQLVAWSSPELPGEPVGARAEIVAELVPGWIQQLGKNQQSVVPKGIVVSAEGDVYVAGESLNETTGTLSLGLADTLASGRIFLAKYDARGRRQWVIQFGDVSTAFVQLLPDPTWGGVQVLTWRESGIYKNARMRQFKPDGSLGGEGDLGIAKFGRPSGYVLDADFNAYVTIATGKQVLLAKLEVGASGWQPVWRKPVGDCSGAIPPVIDSRGFISVASACGDAFVRVVKAGDKDTFERWTELVQFDRSGQERWRRELLKAEGLVLVTALSVDAADHLMLGGAALARFGGEIYRGAGDGFVMRVGPEGRPRWTRRFSTHGGDLVYAVAPAADRLHVFGTTKGRLEDPDADVHKAAPSRGFLASFDADGRRQFLTYTAIGSGGTPVMGARAGEAVYFADGAEGPVKEGWEQRGRKDLFVAQYTTAGETTDSEPTQQARAN